MINISIFNYIHTLMRFFYLLTLILFFNINYIYSQNSSDKSIDSFKILISDIDNSYKSKKITKGQYFDSIYNLANGFVSYGAKLSNKELIEILQYYRLSIWEDDENTKEQIRYYSIFSNQAQIHARYGEMLYYAEKINELELKINKEPSIIALTIIADYYNTIWNYKSTQELYISHKKFIQNLPNKIQKENTEIRTLVQTAMMLEKFGMALYSLKDTANANEIENIVLFIDSFAKAKYPESLREQGHIYYCILLLKIYKYQNLNANQDLVKTFNEIEVFINNPKTPEEIKSSASFTLIDNKIIYFLDHHITDSSKFYLDYISTYLGDIRNNYSRYMLKKYKSRYLYEIGDYKNSIDTLKDALLISEDIRKEISTDINDLMYARAKSDNQQFELQNSEILREKSEKKILYLIGIILAIILGSLYVLNFLRKKHQRRFLQFKLSLARDLHDETGPVLLYAKTLSHNIQDEKIKKELETHLDKTLEMIRSLSHDIKSEKQNSTTDLYYHVQGLLKKLNIENSFTFNINYNIENGRFLSLYQFSQLKSIINECITNTIKHASFMMISIQFSIENQNLKILYTDDGNGWEEKENYTGIGLENIKERVNFLNGSIEIENNFPVNYLITIQIPLR